MDSNNSSDRLPLPGAARPGARRFELRIEGILYQLQEIGGRRVQARRVCRGVYQPDYSIRQGEEGPELVFKLSGSLFSRRREVPGTDDGVYDPETARAVRRPDSSSAIGIGRPELVERFAGPIADGSAVLRFWRRTRVALAVLVCALTVFASNSYWGIGDLGGGQVWIEARPQQLETRRASSGEDYMQIGRLIDRLIYRQLRPGDPGIRESGEDLLQHRINMVMREFGAEEYAAPPEFVKQVGRHILEYQSEDHDIMARALLDDRQILERMRQILRLENLPEDLAYMALVESELVQSSVSVDGAAGFWQFTEETAREYGMKVDESADDRMDLSKSTEAAGRYIRDLILDFGSGSSVMLAMAAYNSGPEKVRRAIRGVKDPIKQRNFWFLYQTKALPPETRDYVPKVFAAILIGRSPQEFGF